MVDRPDFLAGLRHRVVALVLLLVVGWGGRFLGDPHPGVLLGARVLEHRFCGGLRLDPGDGLQVWLLAPQVGQAAGHPGHSGSD